MEYALPELLSREDILKIFNQRHLNVNNINELTHDELLRLYKIFVMPLSRRPERNKRTKQNCNFFADRNEDYETKYMQVDSLENSCNAMDIDFTGVEKYVDQLRSSNRMPSPAGEKRRQRDNDDDIFNTYENDYQYQLSSVTKRIRINSLS